ncbi:MAG: Gfo/Idh/MocA family oxidoreductase [Anaerolineae bacterium]|nr:Gfo/Idh/MocA family oxidoreductase [Anaerolineae bacterium]
MTSKPMRAAVIGAGWAGEQHLLSYKQLGLEVVAVSDATSAASERIAAKHSVADQYADYRELLARDDIDVISVATPNYLHAPMTIAALDSGKHVMCEKPLARTAAEAKMMVDAAERNNRALMVAFNHRQRGDVRLLRRHIEEGGLGTVYHAKSYWLRRDGIPGLGGWFTSKEQAGGGPFIDLGVHMLDMAMHLLGELRVISASAAAYAEFGARGRGSRGDAVAGSKSGMDVEDFATAFLRLEGGVTLNLDASWAMFREVNDLFGVRLYGTEGGAAINVVNYTSDDTLTIYRDVAGAPAEIHPKCPPSLGHLGVVSRFVDVVKSGDWADHRGRDGFDRSVVLDACYRSAEEGREVQIAEILSSL